LLIERFDTLIGERQAGLPISEELPRRGSGISPWNFIAWSNAAVNAALG